MGIVLTDKPAMARSIASVLGANEKAEGYLYGNGYAVTWIYGHLLAQAPPSAYGLTRVERQALPLIPIPFRLAVRQVRTEQGYVTDLVAIRQLEVLCGLLENADALVIATDTGREGELISRYLLDYLGYRKPALHLWISSLTEKAILSGFKNLRESGDFDNLTLVARARREADWILGVNMSITPGIAAGMGNHSFGQVQTPTLTLVYRRYLENRDFVLVSCFHLQTGACKYGQKVLFTCPLRYERKEDAEKARARLEDEDRYTVLAVERKKVME